MKAKINIPNIRGYLQAHYREALDELGFLESHIKEQALFRLWLVKQRSPECYESNICTHCGCTVDSKIFEDRSCSGTCYGEMLSKDKWEHYKEYHPLYKKFLNNDTSVTQSCIMVIRDFSKEESLADLMENNPTLSKEELLYWCPGIK